MKIQCTGIRKNNKGNTLVGISYVDCQDHKAVTFFLWNINIRVVAYNG